MTVFNPPVNLKGFLQVKDLAGFWEDDGTNDPFVGYPYQFKVLINTEYQQHGSPFTPTGYFYSGLDVTVGMWVVSGNQLGGFAWRINEISDASDGYVEAIIEDVERYNMLSDIYQSGGSVGDGDCMIFGVDSNGHPILNNMPGGYFDATLFPGIVSRFNYLNPKSEFAAVSQTAHGLEIGDMVVLQPDATFIKVAAVADSKEALGRIVGQVTQIKGADQFYYKPRGEVRENVMPAFPADSVPGQLIYLDPVNPGKLTATRPTKLATPIYIRLETLTKGIYMGAGSGGGAVDEDELRFATVYHVANLAARDLLDLTKLKPGDQAYIEDAGQGEWALHMVRSKTLDPLSVSWTKLVDFDSSTVDGRTVGVTFDYKQAVPLDLYRISPLDRVTVVTVEVLEAFHTSADLSIGDDADHERLAESQHIDLSTLGTYTITPSYQYGGTEESMIRAYPNPGTSTSGRVKVTISYI
jgi:hypothetical protein